MSTQQRTPLFVLIFSSLLFMAVFLLCFSSSALYAEPGTPVNGIVRYVSASGNDSGNDCSVSTNPCRTVQHVFDDVQNGDEVWVAEGTYTGVMTDPSGMKATVLIADIGRNIAAFRGGYKSDFTVRDVERYQTIISAAGQPGAFAMVTFNTSPLIEGLTLTGSTGPYPGDGTNGVFFGGGLRIVDGAPVVRNNIIRDNHSIGGGGGIYVGSNATPEIVGNTIISNTADDYGGGGILVGNAGAGWTIRNNTIAYNRVVTDTSGGGGIRTLEWSMPLVIDHNEVFSNSLMGGGGGGIQLDSPAVVNGNNIHHNRVTSYGAALWFNDVADPSVIRNNIVANNYGGGIQAVNTQDVRIINNTVARNVWVSDGAAGGGIDIIAWPPTSTLSIDATIVNNIAVNNEGCGIIGQFGSMMLDAHHNDVHANGTDYCVKAEAAASDISVDPRFVDPGAGDFHLLPDSPAINAGDNAFAPPYDRDGIPRPQMEQADMGAYEYLLADKLTYLPVVIR